MGGGGDEENIFKQIGGHYSFDGVASISTMGASLRDFLTTTFYVKLQSLHCSKINDPSLVLIPVINHFQLQGPVQHHTTVYFHLSLHQRPGNKCGETQSYGSCREENL